VSAGDLKTSGTFGQTTLTRSHSEQQQMFAHMCTCICMKYKITHRYTSHPLFLSLDLSLCVSLSLSVSNSNMCTNHTCYKKIKHRYIVCTYGCLYVLGICIEQSSSYIPVIVGRGDWGK